MIKNETRNGISRSYPSEHGGVSIKETKSYGPQGDNLIFSNTEALLPNGEYLTCVVIRMLEYKDYFKGFAEPILEFNSELALITSSLHLQNALVATL